MSAEALVDRCLYMMRMMRPEKLVARLRAMEPEGGWPASNTAGGILDRAGLVRRRNRRRSGSPWSEPFAAAENPNDVWFIDFKGRFRTRDGVRIDPLTLEDTASRYLVVCNGLCRVPEAPSVQLGWVPFIRCIMRCAKEGYWHRGQVQGILLVRPTLGP
jgi:hypothetical protein